MSNVLVKSAPLPPCTPEAFEKLKEIESQLLAMPQVEIETTHRLHAGVYSRTIKIPAGVAVAGVIIKCATQLIISGHVRLTCGDKVVELQGYHVLNGVPGRKQIAFALEDTYCTMLFATDAKTVEEAENEFTDEADKLLTRKEKMVCQVDGLLQQ